MPSSCDINNDGYDDIIIPEQKSSAINSYAGRVVIYFGKNLRGSYNTNNANIIINGEFSNDWFGSGLSCLGDVDGDGWQDFLVGASHYPSGSDTGKVYIYNLNYNHADLSVEKIEDIVVTQTQAVGSITNSNTVITNVEYRIDNGEWASCESSDGSFDEESEDFVCSLVGLSEGDHNVQLRYVDENGVYIPSTMYASEDFSVITAEEFLPQTGRGNLSLIGILIFILPCILMRKRFNKKL